MLSVSQICEILNQTPSGFKIAHDEFFSAANGALLLEYKKLGVISNTEKSLEDYAHSVDKPHPSPSPKQIYCNVPGCKLIFESVITFQTHFNSIHRYVCAECRRSLPTAHLLDLHISEQHDSYFAARKERGEPMYACYLEECQKKLLTPEERKEHCIREHKFPGNFRFDQLSGKAAASAKKSKERVQGKSAAKAAEMDSTVSVQERSSSSDIPMETNEENTEIMRKFKAISFGHQKEKTFHIAAKQKRPEQSIEVESEQPLKDLHALQDALKDV